MHPVLVFVWWIICFVLCVGLLRSILSMRQGIDRLRLAQSHLQETEKIGLELLQKEQSANSALTKERIIRDELGLQKPGETVLQLPSSTQ